MARTRRASRYARHQKKAMTEQQQQSSGSATHSSSSSHSGIEYSSATTATHVAIGSSPGMLLSFWYPAAPPQPRVTTSSHSGWSDTPATHGRSWNALSLLEGGWRAADLSRRHTRRRFPSRGPRM
eukprot:1013026-Rhodomonas_salina.1